VKMNLKQQAMLPWLLHRLSQGMWRWIGKQQGSHHETYNQNPPCTPVLNVADLLITHLQLVSPDQP
jgi:hypothetical protein